MHPMFLLANSVSTEYGKVIAMGISYELRVPFFLGAINYGQEDLVKYMADMEWGSDLIPQLQEICKSLEDYEPDLINWVKNKFVNKNK